MNVFVHLNVFADIPNVRALWRKFLGCLLWTGGGPGSVKDAGYPPWTAQRVEKALQRYDVKFADTTAFLALGAGNECDW